MVGEVEAAHVGRAGARLLWQWPQAAGGRLFATARGTFDPEGARGVRLCTRELAGGGEGDVDRARRVSRAGWCAQHRSPGNCRERTAGSTATREWDPWARWCACPRSI